MTLSRMPILAVAATLPMAASAQSRSADEALAAQQQTVRDVVRDRCPPAPSSEIQVCASIGERQADQQRYRLPLPVTPDPGARQRLVAGEAPRAMDGLNAAGCDRACHQPVQIDIGRAVEGVRRILERLGDD